jgi:hypothetical protein
VSSTTLQHASLRRTRFERCPSYTGPPSCERTPPRCTYQTYPSSLSSPDEPKLGEVIPLETGRLDAIKTRLVTPPRSWDVDTLFHIRHATRHDGHLHWYLIITAALCILTALLLLYDYVSAQWHYWFHCDSPQRNLKESNPAPQISPSPNDTPEVTVSSTERDHDHNNVTFATYSMQRTM